MDIKHSVLFQGLRYVQLAEFEVFEQQTLFIEVDSAASSSSLVVLFIAGSPQFAPELDEQLLQAKS